MNNFGTIPNEIVNKIFLYTSHPTADIIRKYMSDNNCVKLENFSHMVQEHGILKIQLDELDFITSELLNFPYYWLNCGGVQVGHDKYYFPRKKGIDL